MPRRRRARPLLPLLLLLLLSPATARGGERDEGGTPDGEAVRFARGFALAPDGETLVLAWRDDLWAAPAAGGPLRRLTFHPAVEDDPHVSPDGEHLAFVSTRSGTRQVWVMPLAGGAPRRLTSHTEDCHLEGWFPDGQAVLMRQARDHDWRRDDRLFRRPLDPSLPATLLFDDHAYDARVSPDGRRVAFVREGVGWTRKGYRGAKAAEVWVHDLATGAFEEITRGDHQEREPRWLPDGRRLLLASEAEGPFDLYTHDLETGARERLTSLDEDGAVLTALSSDGSTAVFRRLDATWRLDLASGLARPLSLVWAGEPTVPPLLRRELDRADAVAFTTDAREVAFAAGGDVWVMDTTLREPVPVTTTPHEESEPLFSPDGETLAFVRDADGRPDVWVARREDPSLPWWRNRAFALERVTDDAAPERDLSFTPDGKRLVFVRGLGDLWWMKPDGTDARRLVASSGGMDHAFSPDGRWIAWATEDTDFNRDVWLAPVDGSKPPVNVSRHPDDDGRPTFSPDGRLLAFTGRRWDQEIDLYYVWLREADDDKTPRDLRVEKALEAMKGRGKKEGEGASTLTGTWRGRLVGGALPAAGLGLSLVLPEEGAGGAATLSVGALFRAPLVDVVRGAGRLRAAVESPLGRIALAARLDQGLLRGTWRLPDGRAGTFEARPDPAGERARPGASKRTGPPPAAPVAIDLEGIADRVHRIAIPNTAERGLVWMGEGARLAFAATVDGQEGLYAVSFPDALKPRRLSSSVGRGARWLPEAKKIGWLLDGRPATLDAGGRGATYGFSLRQTVDVAARHVAAFDVAWRTMRDTYYDPRLNGLDWDAVRAKYRPLAEAALASDELEIVVDLMLGELNGSHLGFGAKRARWSPPGWQEETGHLGLRLEAPREGEGLLVAGVVPGGPADREACRVREGERLLAIDGVAVAADTHLARLLTGDPRRDVRLGVRDEHGDEREVVLRPTSPREIRRLLYDAWVDAQERYVEERSEGRLGYLHVRGMNWSSFQRFEAALYAVGHGREGLVIDVRDNGGGFTTDHLLTCLTQPVHAFTVARGGAPGYPQDRMVYARWTKPIVVLVNQNSFSNAEIFAHAIRLLGRGPLVGVPTAGGVISTGRTEIMDVGSLRLPFRGWFSVPDGEDMERRGCVPDHLVRARPGDREDRQLAKAVAVLLEEVAERARRPAPVPRYASERDGR